MAIAGVTDDSAELRARIALAKSVLGHAPLYRAVVKALAALEGASLEALAADSGEREKHETPPGSREYLRGWHDGHDAGYAAALERAAQGDPAV